MGSLSDADAVRKFLGEREYLSFVDEAGKALSNDDVATYAAKKVVIGWYADGGEEVQAGEAQPSAEAEGMGEEMPDEPKSAPKPKTRAVERIVAAPFANAAGAAAAASKRSRFNAQKSRFGVGGGKNQVAFDDYDRAEVFGAWARSVVFGQRNYAQKASDLEIVRKASVTNVFTAAGALVPDDFRAELIDIVLEYGAARQVCGVMPMSRDVLTLPRKTADVTAYWTGENASITESDPAFDRVQLVAQKLASLSKVSNELLNDSAVNVSSILAQSIARAHAEKEDDAFFNGDGTSTYGGIQGVIGQMKALGTNPEDAAGLALAAGDIWAEITQANIEDMFAKLYAYSGIQNPALVCHSKFYWTVLVKFLHRNEHVASGSQVGGYTYNVSPSGRPATTFYGYPVIFSNKMPTASTGTSARDTVPLLFGDFGLGAKMGEVSGGMEVATSEHFDFDNDVLTIRSTNRVAINVHDVGDTSTPGPIVGLIMEDA